MSKPIDYLMDPQPWNPKCNYYLSLLSDIIADSADQKAAVEKAYKIRNRMVKEANKKLIDDLKGALGKNWEKFLPNR